MAGERQQAVERRIGPLKLDCVVGDIAAQAGFDAVVNAANAALMPGGGVAGAIHRAAGPGLARECASLAPIKPGEAVITSAHDLPNTHVIHCLGPVYGRDKPEAELLARCYRRALALAEDARLASIAFPAISTGIFGYPLEAAARIALKTVVEAAPGLDSLKHIRFVLYDQAALDVFAQALARLDLDEAGD